jgi:hypothetical protein
MIASAIVAQRWLAGYLHNGFRIEPEVRPGGGRDRSIRASIPGGTGAGAPESGQEGPIEPRLLDIDHQAFADAFGRRPLAIRHALADHPLLSLEAIAELSDSLPLRAIERHHADQPLVVPGGAPELTGPPSETVRGIETNRCWMVLWNIEQSPQYKALLDACLDEAEEPLGGRGGGMLRRQAFLFLSAPKAVTPVHFDPEHNFLAQIRGTKEISVGRFPDPADMQRELDRYHDGGHRNLDRIPPAEATLNMAPGDGVYVYPWAPHWVQNGPEVATSLSITFRTKESLRAERTHWLNARLRRLGRKPRPAGASPATDRVKGSLVGAVQGVRSMTQRGPRIARSAPDVPSEDGG